MLPDRVSNPGPLTYESDAPPIALRDRAKLLKYGKSRKENPQKLTKLSSRSHPRHLVGKRTAQKDTIIDITSDSQQGWHIFLKQFVHYLGC